MGIIETIGPKALDAVPSEGLYGLYLKSPDRSRNKVKEIWLDHRREEKRDSGYLDAVGGYRRIEDYSEKPPLDDQTLIRGLFKSSEIELNNIFKHQFKVCKIKDAGSFYRVFKRARKLAFHAVVRYKEILPDKSFPATYFHQDIVMMFDQRVSNAQLGMFDREYARKRVAGTSEIMLRTLYGAREYYASNPSVLANCLMLAEMHKNRTIAGKTDPFDAHFLYNQSSAAFTLLTFSYLLGKAISKEYKDKTVPWEGSLSETDWYFYWKALGSTMGIRNDLLPDTQDQAEKLWRAFLDDEGTKIVAPERLDLLVNTEGGIDAKDIDDDYIYTLGYSVSDSTLFGSNADEVVELLEIGLQKHSNGEVDLKIQESDYESIVKKAVKEKIRERRALQQDATLAALMLLRHSPEKKVRKIAGESNAKLRKLVYLVNVIHLLETYREATSELPEISTESMKASLAFNTFWPLTLRRGSSA